MGHKYFILAFISASEPCRYHLYKFIQVFASAEHHSPSQSVVATCWLSSSLLKKLVLVIGSPRMSRSNLLSRALIVQVCRYPRHNHPWAWYVQSPYLCMCVIVKYNTYEFKSCANFSSLLVCEHLPKTNVKANNSKDLESGGMCNRWWWSTCWLSSILL